MINASIVGATGYTGVELIRLLFSHPNVKLAHLTTRNYTGKKIREVFPSLTGFGDKVFTNLNLKTVIADSDIIFIALPHGNSVPVVLEAVAAGKKVIDLGADFRFRNVSTYENWYGIKHEKPELSKEAVYGLPEIHREIIKDAKVIANPGCYPTSTILGLAPLLKASLVKPNSVIVDSKSGVSGAGRSPGLGSHFSECNESIKAYSVCSHRHTPEMEQEISGLLGKNAVISFTPHLIPMTRGILSTIYCQLTEQIDEDSIRDLYTGFYESEPFVHVLEKGILPQTKCTYGSNNCHIGLACDKRTGRTIIISAIDNLVKGASGQAIQNMNIVFGLPETTGLQSPALFP
jgi:N-acetyl-gamma-glutamyl-phosphate reductase